MWPQSHASSSSKKNENKRKRKRKIKSRKIDKNKNKLESKHIMTMWSHEITNKSLFLSIYFISPTGQ